MKNSISLMGYGLCLSALALSACQSPTEKIQAAEEQVRQDENDLAKSKAELYSYRLDTISNYDQFRIEADKAMKDQADNIGRFKDKMANETDEVKAEYNEKIAELEAYNERLKVKLSDFKDDGQESWESFKEEFNHDMNQLGKAFNALTVNNKS